MIQINNDELLQARKEFWSSRLEYKQAKYKELADKASEQSEQALKRSKEISDIIPFGQPILVGHYSEQRHRKAIERISNGRDKAYELQDKAEYYNTKLDNLENDNVIRSDDPEALSKLKLKLIKLEAKRQEIKNYNMNSKKNNHELIPAYVLQNLGANIRAVQDRIKSLEAISGIEFEPVAGSVNGQIVNVSICKIINRVKIEFDGKPSSEVIARLKSDGFKWSPFNKAWIRLLNNMSVFIAKQFIKNYIN